MEDKHDVWELNIDRVANPERSGGRVVLVSLDRKEVCFAFKY